MRKILGPIAAVILVLVMVLMAKHSTKPNTEEQTSAQDPAQETMQQSEIPQLSVELGTVEPYSDGDGVCITYENEQGELQSAVFEDIDIDAWYMPAVNYVVSAELMGNASKDSAHPRFLPDHGLTRVQFAQILYRFLNGEPTAAGCPYQDVQPGDWYYDAVCWASEKGYISGVTEDTFGTDEYLNCEQVLIVLYRTAGSPKTETTLDDYPYAPKVSDYGADAVAWAWGNGLIAEEECIWYPTQAISRTQIALLLMRCDVLLKQK